LILASVLYGLKQAVDRLLQCKLADGLGAFGGRQWAELDCFSHLFSEGIGVVWLDEYQAADISFRQSAGARGYHAAAGVLGFDGYHTKQLLPIDIGRWHHDDIVLGHQASHALRCLAGFYDTNVRVRFYELEYYPALFGVGT
jgi:hypothetical protein